MFVCVSLCVSPVSCLCGLIRVLFPSPREGGGKSASNGDSGERERMNRVAGSVG